MDTSKDVTIVPSFAIGDRWPIKEKGQCHRYFYFGEGIFEKTGKFARPIKKPGFLKKPGFWATLKYRAKLKLLKANI